MGESSLFIDIKWETIILLGIVALLLGENEF